MSAISLKDNPPSRYPEGPIVGTDSVWWVAKVKPRQEKALAVDLVEKNVEYFLPMYTKISRRSDGKNRKSLLLLFPSYLPFVHNEPYTLLSLNRIATILKVPNQQRFKEQLQYIYNAFVDNTEIMPFDPKIFKVGQKVKIFKGPFRGMQGRVAKVGLKSSVLLTIDILGTAVVAVDHADLEIIDDD